MSHESGGAHEHDLGLAHDLPTVLNRRRALGLLSAAGLAAALAACGGSSDSPRQTEGAPQGGAPGGDAPPGGAPGSAAAVADGETPEETGGPYPADGSNGVDVLGQSGIVRSDLTRSFGGAGGVAAGVPTTVVLTVVDMNGDEVKPYEGAALYLWHCDQAGRYSMYDDAIRDENYLRGVQVAGADGKVTFTTIFPAAYDGRWPHMHFEVYRDQASATTASDKLRTSQLAIPEDACTAVYATSGYEASVKNMQRTSLDDDMVFGDGYSLQLAKATGSVDAGYTLTLNVAV